MKYEVKLNGVWFEVDRASFDLWKGERRVNGLPFCID